MSGVIVERPGESPNTGNQSGFGRKVSQFESMKQYEAGNHLHDQ